MKIADRLIVVDMQNDFIDGSLGNKDASNIVDNVCNKIKQYVDVGKQIYYTMDTHHDNYLDTLEGKYLPVPHCIKNNYGWQLNDKIKELAYNDENAKIIQKESLGTFNYGSWDIEDLAIKSIEICGICIISNALILRSMFPEATITVDKNCCAGTSVEDYKAALIIMNNCYIDII